MERVLVITDQTLFTTGIVCWLLDETMLEVQTVSPHNRKSLYRVFRQFQPDVVVLDEETFEHNLSSLLLGFLPCRSLRLVGVNSQNGMTHVYDVRQVYINQISDFTTLVMGT